MGIKINDYVRTKKDMIAKIINKKDISGSLHNEEIVFILDNGNTLAINSMKVIKSSPNIIDLIEAGDYVNGYKVYEENGYLWVKRISEDEYKVPHYTRIDFEEFKIKSIVTKEQFEQMEYKIN